MWKYKEIDPTNLWIKGFSFKWKILPSFSQKAWFLGLNRVEKILEHKCVKTFKETMS